MSTLNNNFNNIPQYPINNTDARIFYTYKHSSISVPNPFAEGRAEKRAEELNEAIKKGKYFYITFTAQLNCSGYNFENNTFERVEWKNVEKNRRKFVFEIKTYDYKTQQEQYGNFDTTCSSLFINMAGIIGMYRQLLFPTYASEKIVSIMTLPPIKPGKIEAKIVTIGMREFRNTCLKTTTRSGSPLALAVRTKSWPITSSMPVRM